MEDKSTTMLDEEIVAVLDYLKTHSPDSEEYTAAADNFAKLYQVKIDSERVALDKCEHIRERLFKYGMGAAELVLPLIFNTLWLVRGFRFEETGTITSNTFKWLINRFGRKK